MISLDKKYITRSGHPVKLYFICTEGVYPVHGAYLSTDKGEDNWTSKSWTLKGEMYSNRAFDLDLIEEPDLDLIEEVGGKWINLYRSHFREDFTSTYVCGDVFPSEKEAHKSAFLDRVACINLAGEGSITIIKELKKEDSQDGE